MDFRIYVQEFMELVPKIEKRKWVKENLDIFEQISLEIKFMHTFNLFQII